MAKLTMLLAYGPNQPDGDVEDKVELTLPLTPQGWLDADSVAEAPHTWPGQRMLPGGRSVDCELVRLGEGWALQRPGREDDPVWDFEGRVFRPGEYVTLRDPAATEFVFRIVSIARE